MKPSLIPAYILDTYAQAAGTTNQMLRVNLDYMPDHYTVSKSAQYITVDTMGRSEPIRGYMSSAQRVLRLEFVVGIDAVSGLNPGQPSYQVTGVDPTYGTALGNTQTLSPAQTSKQNLLFNKQNKINFLWALLYPSYDSSGIGMIKTPPPVLIVIGSYFAMLGIVTTMEITDRVPYDFDTGISHWSDVSMTIEETSANPFSYQEVRQGALGQPTLPSTT